MADTLFLRDADRPRRAHVRAKVVETPEFLEAEKPASLPIMEVLRRHPMAVLLALGISIISNSSFYILAYIPTYGVKTLHLPPSTGFIATLLGGGVAGDRLPVVWSMVRQDLALVDHGRVLLAVRADLVSRSTWRPAFIPSPGRRCERGGLLVCSICKAGYSGVLPYQLMGFTPTFKATFYTQKSTLGVPAGLALVLNACTATKLSLPTKTDDYEIQEFDFSAFADATGTIGTLSTLE